MTFITFLPLAALIVVTILLSLWTLALYVAVVTNDAPLDLRASGILLGHTAATILLLAATLYTWGNAWGMP